MESRRLRTGQRGLSTPKRSSSSRTQNGGGNNRGSRKRDDRASGGGGATITTTTTTNREEGTVDGLLESFQDRSEADSHTALSSLLPTTVLNPCNIRDLDLAQSITDYIECLCEISTGFVRKQQKPIGFEQ